MNRIFISDVHLGAFDEHTNILIENELIELIDFCEENQIHPTILGDLFDFWMEYSGEIPELGESILKRCRDYNHSIKQILYITGNHDNWTSGYFSDLGFDVESEFRILNLNGIKILLLHGDGLSDQSFGLKRPFLHRLLRHPNFVKLYQSVFPPKSGLRAMKLFSDVSKLNSQFDTERLTKWAEKFLNENDYDFILSGHDHCHRKETFSGGCYINTGPFFKSRSVIFYTNNCFQLVSWNANSRELIPF
ncbi:MAG: UDP-2,3-diacylglucosamine diphosphatase [Balneolaceae bacterium]